MASQELELLIKLKDEASAQLRQMNSEIQTNAKTWKDNYGAISLAMTGAGLAMVKFGQEVTGAFVSFYQASETSRLVTASLANTLENIGVSYDAVSGQLNAFTDAASRNTNFSKGEQIAGLDSLLLVTGNYTRSLELLPVAMDLAAKKQMDLTDAARLLGRVAEGDINALNRYGFSMDGVTSAGAALKVIQDKVTGSAQDMVSPLTVLKNTMNDLAEKIGDLISGPAGKILKLFTDMAVKAKEWADKNPELATTLLEVGGAIGIALIVVGSLALAFVAIGAAIAFIAAPVLLVIGLIGLLVAAGILMALNWDWVKEHWTVVWGVIKSVLVIALGPIGYLIGLLIQSAADFIMAWDPTASFWTNLWKGLLIVAKNFMNDIVFVLNVIPRIVNSVLGMLGVGFKFGLFPEITPEMLKTITGIDISARQQAGGGAATGLSAITGAGTVSPINQFGQYGGLGQTYAIPGGTSITINNAGSVISEKDLTEQIRQLLIQLQNRNGTTGIK